MATLWVQSSSDRVQSGRRQAPSWPYRGRETRAGTRRHHCRSYRFRVAVDRSDPRRRVRGADGEPRGPARPPVRRESRLQLLTWENLPSEVADRLAKINGCLRAGSTATTMSYLCSDLGI